MSVGESEAACHLLFESGNALFALPLPRLHSVVFPQSLTLVPLVPKSVAGVMNLRGRVLTVVDFHRLVLGGAGPCSSTASIIVLRHPEYFVGMLVDKVHSYVSLPPAGIGPVSDASGEPASRRLRQVVSGLARLENRVVHLLDADAVLAAVEEDCTRGGPPCSQAAG